MAYNLRFSTPDEAMTIVACAGLISPIDQPDCYVMVKNKRGWDVPGGRTEPGEMPIQTMARELSEEAGCDLLPGARLLTTLAISADPSKGVALFRGSCTVPNFTPNDEIEAVTVVAQPELVARYFGDKDLLRAILQIV